MFYTRRITFRNLKPLNDGIFLKSVYFLHLQINKLGVMLDLMMPAVIWLWSQIKTIKRSLKTKNVLKLGQVWIRQAHQPLLVIFAYLEDEPLANIMGPSWTRLDYVCITEVVSHKTRLTTIIFRQAVTLKNSLRCIAVERKWWAWCT